MALLVTAHGIPPESAAPIERISLHLPAGRLA